MKKLKLISFGVSTGPYEEFVDQIINLGLSRTSAYICVANVHMVVEAWLNREFANIVNGAEIVTPDGMPLVKALKLLYSVSQERVAGMDLMPDILAFSEKSNCSIYLYGSTEEVLGRIASRIAIEYPSLKLVGMYSPPFHPLTEEEDKAVIEAINRSGANIVLVSLGCPKQEIWMAGHKGKINAVMVGIGGAFPVFSGLQKRAPKWMRDHSLEWFYRLLQEPRRLLTRYLFTNTLFLGLLAREYMKKILGVQGQVGLTFWK